MFLRSFFTLSGLLFVLAICGQPSVAVEQVMQLLELSKSNFREIAGPYDPEKKVWNTTFHLENSTDNWLLLANEYNFCFFQARLIETQKLKQTKDAVNEWVEKLRPKLKDFNETYIQHTKSIFNVKYDQYIFHKLEAGSQFVVKVEAIKNDKENFYKAAVTVWRQWGDMIKKY